MKEKYVIPGKDLLVRYPGTIATLPNGGAVVPRGTYWRRRAMCGDVTAYENKAASMKKPKTKNEVKDDD
jgi:hypothetical protein